MSLIYRKTIAFADKFVPPSLQPLWNHPAGPKTIFFWSPVFKWGLVIAGLGDLKRPADKISISQSAALTATGLIWSRYSLVIIPKNWSLFSVNVFVAATGLYSLSRAVNYQLSLKNQKIEVPQQSWGCSKLRIKFCDVVKSNINFTVIGNAMFSETTMKCQTLKKHWFKCLMKYLF